MSDKEKDQLRAAIGQTCLNSVGGLDISLGVLAISDALGTLIANTCNTYSEPKETAISTLDMAYENAKSIIDNTYSGEYDVVILDQQTKH